MGWIRGIYRWIDEGRRRFVPGGRRGLRGSGRGRRRRRILAVRRARGLVRRGCGGIAGSAVGEMGESGLRALFRDGVEDGGAVRPRAGAAAAAQMVASTRRVKRCGRAISRRRARCWRRYTAIPRRTGGWLQARLSSETLRGFSGGESVMESVRCRRSSGEATGPAGGSHEDDGPVQIVGGLTE